MVLKVRHLFIALIVAFVLFDSIIGQRKTDRKKSTRDRRPRPKGRPRGREPPVEEPERINCHFCSVSYVTSKLDPTNLCYNPNYNVTAADYEFLTTCSKSTKFCSVDIARLGGNLIQIDRKCGGSTCNYFCITKMYGASIETCTHCCPGKPVVDLDLLEEGESPPIYHCPVPDGKHVF